MSIRGLDQWLTTEPEQDPEVPCPVPNCNGAGEWARVSACGMNDILTCCECGHEWSVPTQKCWGDAPETIEAMERADAAWREESESLGGRLVEKSCRHGITVGEGCDQCDFEADLAYDAWREGRGR